VAAATVALWFRQIGQVDIPEDRTTYVIFFLSAAALGVGAFVAGVRWFGGVAAALAIIIGSFFPFTALDENGEVFESTTLAGNPALIKFFRGHW
jgi:cytochrome oxidase Cu insertion factor (SCO1/SenC/PrrC family)